MIIFKSAISQEKNPTNVDNAKKGPNLSPKNLGEIVFPQRIWEKTSHVEKRLKFSKPLSGLLSFMKGYPESTRNHG